MDTATLLGRRQQVYDRHKTLESVPGSGWHKDDSQPRETRGRGHACLSARPIAIQDDDTVYFVGPDVAVVREALLRFAAGNEPTLAPDAPAQKHQAVRIAKKVAGDSGDAIELTAQQFNSALYGLSEAGLLVVVTGLEDSRSE